MPRNPARDSSGSGQRWLLSQGPQQGVTVVIYGRCRYSGRKSPSRLDEMAERVDNKTTRFLVPDKKDSNAKKTGELHFNNRDGSLAYLYSQCQKYPLISKDRELICPYLLVLAMPERPVNIKDRKLICFLMTLSIILKGPRTRLRKDDIIVIHVLVLLTVQMY